MDIDEDNVINDFFLPGYNDVPEDVLLGCDMCGDKHPTATCHYIKDAPRIRDGVVSRARVTLPLELNLRLQLDSSVAVTAAAPLETGAVFGPMVAPRSDYIANHQFPIKVFGEVGEPDQFLDIRDENLCNWMSLVAPSAEPHLQNIACLQMGLDIYFVVRCPVPAGAQLHVWYSPFYAQKLRHTLTLDPTVAPLAGAPEVVLIRPPPEGEPTLQVPRTLSPLAEITSSPLELREEPPAQSVVMPCGEPSGGAGDPDDPVATTAESAERSAAAEEPFQPAAAGADLAERPCPLCGVSVLSAEALARHLLSRHAGALVAAAGPQPCPVCSRRCRSGRALLPHLRRHCPATCRRCRKVFTRREKLATHPCPGPRRAAEGFACPHCARLFTSPLVLRRHVQRHTGALRCADCRRHFISSAALDTHVCRARVPAARLLPCPSCSHRFANAASLAKHAAVHGDRYRCPRCRRRFSGNKPLRRHQALCGAAEQLRQHGSAPCRQCGVQLSSLPQLAQHVRRHELPHRCRTCRRGFRSELQLGSHVCTRPAGPPRQPATQPAAPAVCEVCARTFSSKKALWLHRKTHAERTFACQLCDKKFKRKDILQGHMMKHSEAQVPCPLCHKLLKSHKSLKVHMRLHTGEARFRCDVCDKSFVQKESMLRHWRLHDPGHRAENTCGTCGRTFSSQHHLKQHQLLHTQARDKRCGACGKAYTTEQALQRHRRTVHKNYQYECPFCQMNTKLKGSMSRHLAKLHADQRATWSAEGFIDALYGAGQQAESILTLQPNNTLLLLPSADGDLNSSLPRQSAGLVVEGADADQDVLLYVIDVPDMDITFAS